jgi:hypothetical protein
MFTEKSSDFRDANEAIMVGVQHVECLTNKILERAMPSRDARGNKLRVPKAAFVAKICS